ncbi:inactivation-no-after-potential D protein isoform X3 [Hetaerina americana]|uniref:inactivation-no-after-potential D protein isoform X3 n=1 Tax=Hetaerina americana TaxID=62018 RepID=UPI003A7F2136
MIKYIPGKAVKAYLETVGPQGLIGGTGGLAKRPVIPLKLVSPRIFPEYYRSPFAQSEAIKLSPSRPEKILLQGLKTPSDDGGKSGIDREAEIVATVLAETPKSTSDFEEGDGFVPSPPLQFRLTPGEELTPFEKPSFAETLAGIQSQEKDQQEPAMTVTKISQGHSSSSLDKTTGGSSGAGYHHHDGAAGGGKSSVLLAKHWGPERLVEVLREPNCSLGISIVGGKVDLYNAGPDSGSAISGIFIKNVIPQSPAGRTGELKTGDRILEVDGIDVRHASHERAVEVIRGSGNPVTFLVQSLIQWNEGEERQNGATSASSYHSSSSWASTSSSSAPLAGKRQSAKMRAPQPPKVPLARTPSPDVIQPGINDEERQSGMRQQSSQKRRDSASSGKAAATSRYSSSEEESDDDEEDARDMEGRILTKKGVEISRASAGNVKRTKEEIEADPEEEDEFGYTSFKIQKKYAPLKTPGVDVIVATLERGGWGLGISLAGHKDRNKMAVFVAGMNPNGSAAKEGTLQVGDEILEVNGVFLHGRCHLNASAVIKGLAGPVFKVIVLRRSEAVQELAVKPITQFPVSLDDESPEERFANFKGLRSVTIKKGPQGLGIMIIEGKHAEVGQGIFISDIQEGSAAEQAGLIVGDMILQVNKDVIMGSNYDSAASLLKKTEGVVTLVVCNPNKAKEEEKAKEGGGAKKEDEKPKAPPEPPADPATCEIKPGKETTIEINKENVGLGLSIVGGSDTLLGVIIVHEVYSDGASAKDNRLKPGDQILEVNSVDFRSITHAKALAALRQLPAKFKMTVHRDEASSGKDEDMLDVMEVELAKKAGKGLGLSIVGRKNGPGVYISDVVKGGVAESDGRLMKGDQILAVNGQDLKSASQEEAAAVLKCAIGKVTIKLGRLRPRKGTAPEKSTSPLPASPDTSPTLPVGPSPSAAMGPPLRTRTIRLERGPDGLGFSIVGGHGSPHGDLPIYVKTVFDRGAASKATGLLAEENRLQRGDQILAVDGVSLDGRTHQEAVALLKGTRKRGSVTLTIAR